MRVGRRLILVALALASSAAATGPARAADATLQVVPVGHGSVTFTPAPKPSDPNDPDACPSPTIAIGSRTDLRSGSCTLTYNAGTVVTLVAHGGAATTDPDPEPGPATQFRGWSDDRCQPAGAAACSLWLEPGFQSIAATFSPQRVSWWVVDGSVTSPPSPFPTVDCAGGSSTACVGKDYELGTSVTLTATGTAWLEKPNPTNALTMCDSAIGARCELSAVRPRWAAAASDPTAFQESVPPEVLVRFRVRKAGTGSGTVRGQSLDCGTSCAVDETFGGSQTLQALPDPGSRFDGWRPACGSAPTCRLAVGPVTAVTAVFERASSSHGPSPGPPPTGPAPPNGRKPLHARVLAMGVRGHGRRRTVLLRLEVGAGASVRAALLHGRRRVASRRWRVGPGAHLLRLRVPSRARPGRYRLRLTIEGNGQTQLITRRVRVRP